MNAAFIDALRSTVSARYRRQRRADRRSAEFRASVPEITELEDRLISLVGPFTMTGKIRRFALTRAMDYVNRAGIDGDVVECGVWRGGNAFLARLFQEAAYPDVRRRYFLFDTFEGMSEPTAADVNANGKAAITYASQGNDWCKATIEDVMASASEFFSDLDPMRMIKGKVEDTLYDQSNLPERVAVLRLDTDFYESTKAELEVLYPRLAIGGVLIVDDYGKWRGARRAVDEYFAEKPILLQRIDSSCRQAVKLA